MADYKTIFPHSRVLQEIERRALAGVDPNYYGRRRLMIKLAIRDGKSCCWCHRAVRFVWEPGVRPNGRDTATYEHFKKTKSRGGHRSMKNGKIACHTCNNLRGTQPAEEFLARLEAAGGPEALRKEVKAAARAKRQARQEANDHNYQVRCLVRDLRRRDEPALVDRSIGWLTNLLIFWSHYVILPA